MYARRTRIFGNRASLLLCDLEVSGLRFPSRCDQHRDDSSAHNTAFSASKPCEGTSRQQATQTVTAEKLDQRIRIRQPSQCIREPATDLRDTVHRPSHSSSRNFDRSATCNGMRLSTIETSFWESVSIPAHKSTPAHPLSGQAPHSQPRDHRQWEYATDLRETSTEEPRVASGCRNRVCNESTPRLLNTLDSSERAVHQPLFAHNTAPASSPQPSHSPSHNGYKSVTPDDDDGDESPRRRGPRRGNPKHRHSRCARKRHAPALGSRHKRRTRLSTRDSIPIPEIISKARRA